MDVGEKPETFAIHVITYHAAIELDIALSKIIPRTEDLFSGTQTELASLKTLSFFLQLLLALPLSCLQKTNLQQKRYRVSLAIDDG